MIAPVVVAGRMAAAAGAWGFRHPWQQDEHAVYCDQDHVAEALHNLTGHSRRKPDNAAAEALGIELIRTASPVAARRLLDAQKRRLALMYACSCTDPRMKVGATPPYRP